MTNDHENRKPRRAGVIEIFMLFSRLGTLSFGGSVPTWMHRAFVMRRGWLNEPEFFAALALARMVPGANVLNLAILIGQRLRGAPGALAAATGLLLCPSLAAIGITIGCDGFRGSSILQSALAGIAACAVGLLIGMAVQSGTRLIGLGDKSAGGIIRRTGSAIFASATFVLVGVLRLPMPECVLCLAPVSVALAYLTVQPSQRRLEPGGQ